MKFLFLDDDEFRHEQFGRASIGHDATHVRTISEFTKALDQGPYDMIFLDHDLGGEHYVASAAGTGYEAAQILVKCGEKVPVVVHSYNPAGARNMVNLLTGAGFFATWQPFSEKTGAI